MLAPLTLDFLSVHNLVQLLACAYVQNTLAQHSALECVWKMLYERFISFPAMGVSFLNELMCQITQHAAKVLHFIWRLQGSTEWNLQVFRVLKMALCFLAQKQKSWGWRWEMDCHLGNLTTSCFPVTCVEKCLVASRLCPGTSRCTQVRQGLPVLVTALGNSVGFVSGGER